MMLCTPLALLFGIVGIVKDRPRCLAIVVAAAALLLLSPWLWAMVSVQVT